MHVYCWYRYLTIFIVMIILHVYCMCSFSAILVSDKQYKAIHYCMCRCYYQLYVKVIWHVSGSSFIVHGQAIVKSFQCALIHSNSLVMTELQGNYSVCRKTRTLWYYVTNRDHEAFAAT